MTRKNSTREFWMKHYHSFKAAGVSQREYCRINDLCYWSFNKWKRQFDDESKSTSLQQLPVKYNPVKTEKIEIILHGDITIAVPEYFSEISLRKILSALSDKK